MKTYTRALTIAGSDSGGGAGIQADLKTFSALGCFGTSVITAITAQNTSRVEAVSPLSPYLIRAQIQAVLSDIGTDAIKIGMLFNEDIIAAIAGEISSQKLVLDPVMVAKSGDRLLQENAIKILIDKLFPLATLVTPNLDEAKVILGHDIIDIEKAAQEFLDLGVQAVLIKGGHDAGENSTDYLLSTDGFSQSYTAKRIHTKNTHGTGCTLSAAITAFLAKGCSLPDAVQKAKTYLTEAMQEGSFYQLGSGHGPVHHFYRSWQ